MEIFKKSAKIEVQIIKLLTAFGAGILLLGTINVLLL